MANRLFVLGEELENDPLARAYSGMTNPQIVSSLNAEDRSTPVDEVSSSEIFEALDPAEFAGLNNAGKARVDRLLGLGDGIKVVNPSNARTELLALFVAGTQTRTNLAAIASLPASRANELRIGSVSEQNVIDAKAARGI